MPDPILIERDGGVATVVLNNPQSLNAFSEASWRLLASSMRELSADASLRCIILRGAGEKAFAAGADIAEFDRVRADSKSAKIYGGLIHDAMQSVGQCVHPTVAQIHGVCVGGGLEIASMCDLRICGTSSRFGIPINKLGLVMAYGELQGLLSVVGRAAALEILLEGRVFGADEALAKGLVNRVVADDKVAQECKETAERIAAGAPLVARWHKKFIRRLADPAPISPQEWDEGFACFDSEDYATGRAAFLAKTKPEFKGR
jgi:enoyl-CoA hydratase